MKYEKEDTVHIKSKKLNDSVIHYDWSPGNGTRYQIAVTKLDRELWQEDPICFGALGCLTDGWLVVDGLQRKAYLLQAVGDLHPSYIREKFDLAFEEDARFVTKLISFAIDRPYIGA